MADVIKKIVIPKEDLPPGHIDGNYLIRFRIVSKDGIKSSSWSSPQMISIPVSNNGVATSGSIIADNMGVNIGWKADSLNVKPSFDVYLSWTYSDGYSSPYSYAGTVQSNTYYASTKSDANHGGAATGISVTIQKETALKQRVSGDPATNPVLIFQGNSSTTPVPISLPSSFDAGVIV